jgi:hypothetical protein
VNNRLIFDEVIDEGDSVETPKPALFVALENTFNTLVGKLFTDAKIWHIGALAYAVRPGEVGDQLHELGKTRRAATGQRSASTHLTEEVGCGRAIAVHRSRVPLASDNQDLSSREDRAPYVLVYGRRLGAREFRLRQNDHRPIGRWIDAPRSA